MFRPPPPNVDIPRNLSYISGLYEKAYREGGEEGADEESRGRSAAPPSPRDRRRWRASSLPAGVGRVGPGEEEGRGRGRGRGRGSAGRGRSRSPNTRKRVRFADSLGLELAAVRRFNCWQPPRVPTLAQARDHLQAQARAQLQARAQVQLQAQAQLQCQARDQLQAQALTLRNAGLGRTPGPGPWLEMGMGGKDCGQHPWRLEPAFANPLGQPGFAERLRRDKVCLEGLSVEGARVRGTVRVLNVAFTKEVWVRHTSDSWLSHTDTPARFIPGSADRHADRFAFELQRPAAAGTCGLQLALRFTTGPHSYWDNNGGTNYRLRAVASAAPPKPAPPPAPSPPPEHCGPSWIHFI
ncbi:protein phosphatase 1 regulatory subunit 3E-like [Rhinoraja longicauda]